MASKKSIYNSGFGVTDEQIAKSVGMAREIKFPMEVFPTPIVEWLSALAFSVNTRPEFVLISAISVVSTLMGPKSKVKIRSRYSEPCNLFAVCLSEPGAGKSQAFEIAVENPIKQLGGIAGSLIVQDFTRKGLFQHLVAHEGRALLAHSEMSSFYELILKKQQEGSGERQLFCRLYDGTGEWLLTSATGGNESGDKRERREVLPQSALALGGFTQPGPFLQLFKPLARIQDGFLDRILICSVKPHLLHEEEVEMWSDKLDEYQTQDFEDIYRAVYNIHKDGQEYRYSAAAKRSYIAYSNKLSDKMNEQWEKASICTENVSKDKRNFIRLSCVLHVLLHVLEQFITEQDTEETPSCDLIPEEIDESTLNIARKVMSYFSKQRKAFLAVVNSQVEKKAVKKSGKYLGETSQQEEETPPIDHNKVIESFAEWFVETFKGHSAIEFREFTMLRVGTIAGKNIKKWSFRVKNCPITIPIELKCNLGTAAKHVGGDADDTAYFAVAGENKTGKQKCISIPMTSFKDQTQERILSVLECRCGDDSVDSSFTEETMPVDENLHGVHCFPIESEGQKSVDENLIEAVDSNVPPSESDDVQVATTQRCEREKKRLFDALAQHDIPSHRKRRR